MANTRETDARGLTPGRAAILDAMLAGETRPAKIAAAKGITRQAVYNHLTKLALDGWVAKVSNRDDAKGAWQPTDKAKRDPRVIEAEHQAAQANRQLQTEVA